METKKGKSAKSTTKSKPAEKAEGKCAFIERHLMLKGSARLTKTAIIGLTLKQFPGSSEKTIKNTVNWVAHHKIPKDGKTSNHLDEPRAGSEEKPAAKKSAPPAKKKAKSVPPPRPPKAVEQPQEEQAVA